MKIKELSTFLESLAPIAIQESYDNCGLNIGNPENEIINVLVSLDVTEEVIDEAISKNCNVIVAHHPLIFKGIKKLNGANYVEQCVIKAIKNDLAIYAIHTNLDNAINGVNFKIAETIGLKNIKILQPKRATLMKLTVFVPEESSGNVLNALYANGAGEIGNYSNCSFKTMGQGTFKPNNKANPVIGNRGVMEVVTENRLEVIFPEYKKNNILEALKNSHPYEEIAYYLHTLVNENQEIGSGAVGDLHEEMNFEDFFGLLKSKMKANVIRHSNVINKKVKRVALCGGVGSFLLAAAKKAKADVFVSSDFKYHEFFDAENQIVIADIGHFESEQFTKDLLVEKISKKFTTFATYLSEIDTNPIRYYY